MFNPIADYLVEQKPIHIEDFHRYREDFVVRPPYQRTSVWSRPRQQQLLDSLIRRYYVPRIVLREVRLDDHTVKKEVIDGQQRITTVQLFFSDVLPLPKSLQDVSDEMPGRKYSDIRGIAGETIDELGFDYRNGSHCGGGAPRFGVVSREGFYYFVGCASGTPEPAPPDEGQWTRVRFGAASFVPSSPEAPPFELGVTRVDRLYVVFDEGTDATSAGNPAGSGLAILDNVDVNGELIERGD